MNYRSTDEQYLSLLQDILDNGVQKEDRTGTGTLSVFSRTMRFDISDGKIPLLTTKKVFTKGLIHELLWFLSGDTNIRYLKEHNVSIWDSWVKKGTEEYEWFSEETLQDLLSEYLKKDDPKFTVWFEEDPNVLVGGYDYQNVFDETITKHIGTRFYYSDVDGLRKAFKEYTGKEPRKLTAGELGPVYGQMWRNWEDVRLIPYDGSGDTLREFRAERPSYDLVGEVEKIDEFAYTHFALHRSIDQIAEIIRQLKEDPDSRRIILSAWNVGYLSEMALPPCHSFLQLYSEPMSEVELKNQLKENDIGFSPMELVGVEPGTKCGYDFWKSASERVGLPTRYLSTQLTCRSQDTVLGTPFNIAQYGVFIQMIAQVVNMKTKDFVWSGGDCHIYLNQIEGVKEQLIREPLRRVKPRVKLNPNIKNIDDFTFADIEVCDYESHPPIKFPQAAV